MMQPRSCTSSEQCSGACPAGSVGCTCANSPMGQICVPSCTRSEDCPLDPMGARLQCDAMGRICVPPR